MRASAAVPVAALLSACAAPLRSRSHADTAAAAHALLVESAAAHGATALSTIRDVSVGYSGQWRALVGKLQPALVDAGHRGASEERLLLDERVVAQSFTGPNGHKQVMRHTAPGDEGDVRVWFGDAEAHDLEQRAAAALVADGYKLFLLGPWVLADWATDRSHVMQLDGMERLSQERRHYDCHVLRLRLEPGLGFSTGDEIAVFIDAEDRLMRRVRFTLNGLQSTQGAIAEVELYGHELHYGVKWPTRFHEQLLRPLPLPVHDWKLTGLDVNRGLTVTEVNRPAFAGSAQPPAAPMRSPGP